MTQPFAPGLTRMSTNAYDWTMDEREHWRHDCLRAAGYSRNVSFTMALDHTIDLHQACELLQACHNEKLALDILL